MTESWNLHGQGKHLFGYSTMMPAGYAGVNSIFLVLLAGVSGWNVGQYTGFVERVGTYAPGFLALHNITSIPYNYYWAFRGQYHAK